LWKQLLEDYCVDFHCNSCKITPKCLVIDDIFQ
jgi:hypothetical protein